MISIFIEDSFDSAHLLPNVPTDHKCQRMHGHTYRVRLEVAGEVDHRTGWIIDYAELKAAWEPLHKQLDHQILNGIPGLSNPTCELIAQWIGDRLPMVTRVELRETERCGVIWEIS